MNRTPKPCPRCEEGELRQLKRWYHRLSGAFLVILGLLAAIPTLGLSLVAVIWGVFLNTPELGCDRCGYRQRSQR